MLKLANELLEKLQAAEKTEQNRIAIRRMREVVTLLEYPEKQKKYLAEKAKTPQELKTKARREKLKKEGKL